MKIKSLQLKNFKRFTDLTLQDIPDNAKLVLLIGSNGSGKSSVFDAFERIALPSIGAHYGEPTISLLGTKSVKKDNVRKDKNEKFSISILADDNLQYTSIDNIHNRDLKIDNFYGRSSLRQIPRLTRTNLGDSNFSIEKNSDRPISFIDRDERFENDIENILGKLLKEFFRTDDSKSEIKKSVIDPINEALNRIFNKENGTKLQLIEIIPPLEGKVAAINFKKGESEFHYNYLSAGEKEVFNILLNLVARIEYYQDTIFFFDEIDLHLNTQLQYNFIKEIVENWIPDNCQFWTASHSLGFIQYANDCKDAAIIDFGDLDFDQPQILMPKEKNNFEVFEIAVSKSFIDQVVQGRKIIFSENTNTVFYNDLNNNNTLFFVAIDKMDVFHKAKNHKQYGLIDRDYLSDEEILELKKVYPFLFILPYYSFENLIYHPNNLEEYYEAVHKNFDKANYIYQLTKIKNDERDYLAAGIIQARAGYPFYKENEHAKLLKEFKGNYKSVIELLRSDNFEDFYKVFPAKDYGKNIAERQHLPINILAKTNWFKTQIENIIK
jgi:AAA15 family ATPase/GTPase